MGSALPTLQPKQPEAQTFGLVLNPIPQNPSPNSPAVFSIPQAEVGMVLLSL